MTVEKRVVDLLLAKKLKIAAVESCTGGMVASRIVNVPGASDVLNFSLVTYSNEAKEKLAGVSHETIQQFSAVSKETVLEMAKCPDMGLGADVIVSVSGYAGPGEPNDPDVGLVYIGCNVCGKLSCTQNRFKGDRQAVREAATEAALLLVEDSLKKYFEE